MPRAMTSRLFPTPELTLPAMGFVADDDHCQQAARCPIECPHEGQIPSSEKKKIPLLCGIADGETRTRTGDTTIFSRGPDSLNSADSPATWRFIDPCDYQLNDRKLRSLLGDLGTRERGNAEWRRRGCNVEGTHNWRSPGSSRGRASGSHA
jgi:hypothetical protein